jgi:hypothetical protein
MLHIVLLGDSVFDNGAYVQGGPDVIRQLRDDLPGGWQATLKAVDGAVLAGVAGQLEGVPRDATHLVVSAGGNDALGYSGVIGERLGSMAEALQRLQAVRERFEASYRVMLAAVLKRAVPTALCTIYNPQFPDPVQQRLAVTALSAINDVLLKVAFEHGQPVIDLRLVCSEPADYANPIEPSSRGGEKIAATIASLVMTHDFTQARTTIYR